MNLVIIDDSKIFADSFKCLLRKRGVLVDVYYDPDAFLRDLSRCAKDTKICIDYDFPGYMNGVELAKRLNRLGYVGLYLLSGREGFAKNEVPEYLTMIPKSSMSDIAEKLGI